MRSDPVGASVAGLVVVFFCLLLLRHDPLIFWNDDYELSILPVFADVARSWNEGHWPLLSPSSWVCNNLAGEFQYGTFSIFINLAVVLIWKFPLNFANQAAALSITHLFFLAAGAFLLARDRRCNPPLSVFVALVAALNGWIICWGATDWFGALGAFTWLPWCWWALARALDPRRGRYRFLWPAFFVYLLVTGGFPYTVLMLVVLIFWLAIKSVLETKTVRVVWPMLIGSALGLGISAPAWLAIFDYVHGSARELQPVASHWQWIVPWRAFPGFILPCWTVNWSDFSTRYLPHTATELACGLVAPSALIAGFLWRPRLLLGRLKWELLLLFGVLLLSMLPTFGVFRWSFRWLPFAHLILAICAAEVLRLRRRLAIGSAAMLLLIAVTILIAVFGAGGRSGPGTTLAYFQIVVIWVLVEWFLPDLRVRNWTPAVATFAVLLATYVSIPTNCGVPKYNFSQELTKSEPLDRNRLYLAIYSPAEAAYRREYRNGPVGQVARPGNVPMWAQLRFINGYSPIQSAGVAREFKFFTHGELDGDMGRYLVTNESGPGGILEQLGVDGIVVAHEIEVAPSEENWQLVLSNDDGSLFHRKGEPLAHVRSVGWIDSLPERNFARAGISHIVDSRNEVSADIENSDTDQPALITFSRPYFNGYVARIGHTKLRVTSYRGFFPIVEIPAKSAGRLILSYRPGWLIWGGALSIFCVVICLGGITAAFFRNKTIADSL